MKCPQCKRNELDEFVETYIDKPEPIVWREKVCIVCASKNLKNTFLPLPSVTVSEGGKVSVDWKQS